MSPTKALLRPRNLVIGVAVAAAIGAGVFTTVYLTMFNPRVVAKVALPSGPAASPTGAVSGSWTIGSGSFVGYRVREQLASLPAPSDAVGRTTAVTGTAALAMNADGSATVSAIQVSADLTQLESDASRRDNYLRHNSLETSSFPTATFVSSGSVTVPATAVSAGKTDLSLPGKLTIHGTSKDVAIVLQVQRNGSAVDVVGSYTFQWGDFGVQQPSVPVVSVQGNPVLEISLVLQSTSPAAPTP